MSDKPASDNAAHDEHAVNPMKLGEDSKAHDEIEKRFKKRMSEKSETAERIKSLEMEVKDLKERDPNDTYGRQAKIKEEIELLKKTE